jgi:hypothetical protein
MLHDREQRVDGDPRGDSITNGSSLPANRPLGRHRRAPLRIGDGGADRDRNGEARWPIPLIVMRAA